MLNDAAIRAIKPDGNRTVKLSAGGLQLWVKPSGAKSWCLAYCVGGKQKKLSLGQYPGVGLKEPATRVIRPSGRWPAASQQKRREKAN